MKSKTFLIGLVGGASALAFVGGCELIASVNHDDIKDTTSAGSTTGSGGGSTTSSTTSSASTTSSVSSSSSSSSASSSSGGCTDPSMCMQPTAECEEATCNGMMCGVADKMMGDPCTEGGGQKCDGAGNCVGCLSDGDCSGATPKCDMAGHICVAATCADMTQNGNETDVDCGGGAPCSACPVTKTCNAASDCLSGFCQAGSPKKCAACSSDSNCANSEFCDTTVNGGTCKAKVADGINCTGNNQCTNGHCVGSGLQICCNTACNTTCLTCFQAEKADNSADGTCGPATANTDPRGECPTNVANDCQRSVCDGTTAGGKCAVQSSSATCGQSPNCTTDATSSKFLVQQFCSGASDTCAAPATPQNCPNNFGCQDADTCATACTFNNTAAPNGTSTGCAPLYYCDNPGSGNACVIKKAAGIACTQNYECASNNCDNPGTQLCL